MNKLQINFYDETITFVCPNTYAALKDLIAEKYYLDPVDVDELIKYYINESDRISIGNEFDYQQALYHNNKEVALNKNYIFKLFLEVSEQSKLYKREFESSKLELKSSEKERLAQEEALRREILEKEKYLKEILEKERQEMKERERIAKEKKLAAERLEKERIEKEKLEKERIEKERIEKEKLEKERLEKERIEKELIEKELLRSNISKAVIESVNNSINKIREELIQKTLLETSSLLDKSFCSKGSEIKKNETVHHGYECNECHVFPIVGNRYRCTECFNYDLCENCEETKGDSHGHPLVKHRVEAKGFPFCRERFNKLKPCDRWFFWRKKYSGQMNKMREEYDVSKFTDDQLLEALAQSNGSIDKAIISLFNY